MRVTFNMKDSRPKSRQAKHTIIPDVYNFGLSLVNGLMSKEVDRIYINRESASAPTDNETTPATPELESILKLVMHLQTKVSSLEKGLAEVKRDNLVLQERLSTSSSCCINHTAGTPSPAVDSVCTSEGTNTREADTTVMRDSVPDNGGITPASIITPSQEPSASRNSTDESSDNEESFQPPAHYMRKIRRLEQKVKALTVQSGSESRKEAQHVITSTASHSSQKPKIRSTRKTPDRHTVLKSPQDKDNNARRENQKVLYIGGVSADNSVHDLKIFLKSQGVHNINHVRTLSTKDDWQSFKVFLPVKDYNIALNSTEWPTGITIRPFLVKRGQLSNNGSRQEHRDSTRLRAAKNSYHDYNRRSTSNHANEAHHGQRSRHNQQNSRQDRQQYYQNDSYDNSYYY